MQRDEHLDLKWQIRRRLNEYLKAESAILCGQEYVIGDRHLRRPDLKYVQQQIKDLLTELQAADSSRGRNKRAVFIE
jgi:hypothetical protein